MNRCPIPTLDLAPFRTDACSPAALRLTEELRAVCHEHGFFYVTGHGVDEELTDRMHSLARRFFALPDADRLEIANVDSPQFRGFTPVGHEYTQNRPDRREQLDIGRELPPPVLQPGDPAWLRLRGPNLWPAALPELRRAVESWTAAMEQLGRVVCHAAARSRCDRTRHDSTSC